MVHARLEITVERDRFDRDANGVDFVRWVELPFFPRVGDILFIDGEGNEIQFSMYVLASGTEEERRYAHVCIKPCYPDTVKQFNGLCNYFRDHGWRQG